MCKNIAKSITAIEAKCSNLTKITNIDGRVPLRWPRSRSEHNSSSSRQKGHKLDSFQDPISRPLYWNGQREHKTSSFQDLLSRPQTESVKTHSLTRYESNGSFQDLLSRPSYMDRTPNNEESLAVSCHKLAEQTQLLEQSTEAPQEDLATQFETHFKTLHINGIWVSGEKNNVETHFKTPVNGTRGSREQHRQNLTPFKTLAHILDRDFVKKRSRQTSFKTMSKSGVKNIASQDMVGKVSTNLIPFKTPNIKYKTSKVHFKTFDNWVKARKMQCDTVLKDVSSFISEKMEEDWPRATYALTRSYPSHRQPNSWQAKSNSDPQASRMSPIGREEISMGDYHNRGEFTMEQNRAFPELQRQETAGNSQRGKDSKQNCHGSTPFENVLMWKRPKSPKVTEMTHFKTPGWNRGGRCSRSRSWSWSSGESVTCSAHSFDWYDIDDIDVVKAFHSIHRSRMVASRCNDTDPDSKTKIITKLGIKLLHRWVVNILQVKVDDGAEANILPLHSFRSVSTHSRWRWLPARWIPQRFKDNIRMLQWWQTGKSWEHYIKAQTLHR